MSVMLDGLAVFGVMFLLAMLLLPAFMLQKMVSEERNKERRAKLEKRLENDKLL